jgi:hypothetical protein
VDHAPASASRCFWPPLSVPAKLLLPIVEMVLRRAVRCVCACRAFGSPARRRGTRGSRAR